MDGGYGSDEQKWKQEFKVNIPKFRGRFEQKEFFDQLKMVAEVLDYKDISKNLRVFPVAKLFLVAKSLCRKVAAPSYSFGKENVR